MNAEIGVNNMDLNVKIKNIKNIGKCEFSTGGKSFTV